MPHPTQMTAADTGLLVIDVQEKLLKLIPGNDRLIANIAFLLDAAKLLDMTIQATEQYPKGLGSTAPKLIPRLPERPDKVAFSSCAVPSIVDAFHRATRPKIVVLGIETHVCVLHTTLDLLTLGFSAYIPVDAVNSRFPIDNEFALRRLEQAGAILTTTETCVFEWIGGSDHPQFKAISKLVQERMKSLSN
jgi:nicotinamidase-related amidase